MPDFAFDLHLRAVVRLSAADQAAAVAIIRRAIECHAADLHVPDPEGGLGLVITEISQAHDEVDPPPVFEIDGVVVSEPGAS